MYNPDDYFPLRITDLTQNHSEIQAANKLQINVPPITNFYFFCNDFLHAFL